MKNYMAVHKIRMCVENLVPEMLHEITNLLQNFPDIRCSTPEKTSEKIIIIIIINNIELNDKASTQLS